ncbi:predicted protein [Nematostella vectensis]|uniref:Uncharacterized protein n=1 Tax=Nematostella vectensis TaxID=45351 RepID=A7SE62_NEMVE|nr:predicted protein [Nematostella vectensis]|eukprot:XP_001630015.1 predicted protein [Nematostella vectensis]
MISRGVLCAVFLVLAGYAFCQENDLAEREIAVGDLAKLVEMNSDALKELNKKISSLTSQDKIVLYLKDMRGPVGPQGPEGHKGSQGDKGAIGATGPQGPTGATGPMGPIGPKGQTGLTGAKGPTGPRGPMGNTGRPGSDAPKGSLQCVEAVSRGNHAQCPAGYLATGCACGHRCGSWNTDNHGTRCYCHAGCMDGNRTLDWTRAMCCKVV